MREEQGKQPEGWLAWVRKPWLATALAMVLVVGSGVYLVLGPPSGGKHIVDEAQISAGAVTDLESLDKNHDLYTNSVLLDELSGAAPDDVTE